MLLERPTAYRRKNVSKVEKVVLKDCEIDRLNYQEELLSLHKTEKIFKHLNYLNKSNNIPKVMYKGDEASRSENETSRWFNKFFHSVYTAKTAYKQHVRRIDRSVHKKFDVSRSKLRCNLTDLDITKSRIPNKIAQVPFKKTAVETNTTMQKLFKKVLEMPTMSIDNQFFH